MTRLKDIDPGSMKKLGTAYPENSYAARCVADAGGHCIGKGPLTSVLAEDRWRAREELYNAGWRHWPIPGFKRYKWLCRDCAVRCETYIRMHSGVYGLPVDSGVASWAKHYATSNEEDE